MKVEDILSKTEIEEYHEEWGNFNGKYKPNSCYNVHSGIPVISEVYRFKDKPVFRAHVFQKKLRKFNPYFISKKYFHPFWHVQHYFMVMEQLYHAGANKLRDNSQLIVKDVPERFKLRKPIFWDKPTSVELILENLGEKGAYHQERICFTFYDDRKERNISEVDVMTFYQPRAYVRDIIDLSGGKQEVRERLIRKIQHQAIGHREMTKSRAQIISSQNELIKRLKSGQTPEAELHDFFSFWDKPQS